MVVRPLSSVGRSGLKSAMALAMALKAMSMSFGSLEFLARLTADSANSIADSLSPSMRAACEGFSAGSTSTPTPAHFRCSLRM